MLERLIHFITCHVFAKEYGVEIIDMPNHMILKCKECGHEEILP